ncbi:uncharacterized protein LOC132624556 [Lycium barbarum]|uniref:uncharacterized protein LOC132624556 n=1 Tax=Lycium barbarum TaxID=112863 RepID=UPI00293E55CF|nr:uncharacterized protein LOC132624556 [Lycium barbarum]
MRMISWYSHDRYCLTSNGKYSVTRGYLALLGDRPKMADADLIWSKILLPKHRVVVWLAVQQRLLTRTRLNRLGIECEDDMCVLCDAQKQEDAVHLFVDCDWAKELWAEAQDWMGIKVQLGSVQQTLQQIKQKRWSKFKREIVAAGYGAVIYHIWRLRNGKIFKGQIVHRDFVMQQIKMIVRERISMFRDYKTARKCAWFLARICN